MKNDTFLAGGVEELLFGVMLTGRIWYEINNGEQNSISLIIEAFQLFRSVLMLLDPLK